MAKDKSILEKFTDKVKGIAGTATDAASQALKTDESALGADERAVAYVPLAADGLVSDPLMVPPVAAAPERRKRAVKKRRSASAAKAGTTKFGSSKSSAKRAASKKSSNKKSGPARKVARSARKSVPTKTRKKTRRVR